MTRIRQRLLTLRDVSEASGVSEMTVSRVLRGKGDVSDATRAKVQEAARALGYVPNKIAGALASQRVNLVAVIVPSLGNMVFSEVLSGIGQALEGTGLQAVVGVTDYDPEKEEKVLFDMLSWRPAGVIIAGLEHSDASRAMLDRAGIPVVEIMDVDGTPIDACVGISHRRAGMMMAEAVLAAGYKRVGFIGKLDEEDHRAHKRLEGFKAGLGAEALPKAFYAGSSTLAKGRAAVAELLSTAPETDFVYCANDMIGAGVMLELLARGCKVPEEIGIAGFNDLSMLDGLPLRLATMDSARREIGFKAAQILAERHADRSLGGGQSITLEPVLQRGETLRG